MGKKGEKKKALPQVPVKIQKEEKKVVKQHIFEKRSRNFRIGCNIQPKRDLTRFVKWPKYIQMQRKKRILLHRLKVPPAIHQFNHNLDKNQAVQMLKLLKKYSPETRQVKKQRLLKEAEAKKNGEDVQSKKPAVLKYGLNHITSLIESKKAKLVVIAHDVEPIEMVVWLPALCRKMEVPYCVIKGKSRLGQLVGKKTAAAVCLTQVRKEDQGNFETLKNNMFSQFNENTELRRKWGGGLVGVKSNHVQQKKQRLIDVEKAKKLGLSIA